MFSRVSNGATPEGSQDPRYLILGFTRAGRLLHIQCNYASRPWLKIVTLYEPDPEGWTDSMVRKAD